MQQQKVTRPLLYELDEAQDVRVESTKKHDDLIVQIFPKRKISLEEAVAKTEGSPVRKIMSILDGIPKRKISLEEAVAKTEGSPVRKIMSILDGILPKKNVSVTDKDTYITIYPPDTTKLPAFTVIIEKFYDFPTDLEYMKGKVVTGLKKLKF